MIYRIFHLKVYFTSSTVSVSFDAIPLPLKSWWTARQVRSKMPPPLSASGCFSKSALGPQQTASTYRAEANLRPYVERSSSRVGGGELLYNWDEQNSLKNLNLVFRENVESNSAHFLFSDTK